MFKRLGFLARLATLVLGAAAVLLYGGLGWLSHSLVNDLTALDSENQMLACNSKLHGSLIQYDIAAKSYANTEDIKHLRTMRVLQSEVLGHIKMLKTLVKSDAHQGQRVSTLEKLLQSRFKRHETELGSRAVTLLQTQSPETLTESEIFASAVVGTVTSLTADAELRQARRISQRQEMLWIFWVVLGICALALALLIPYFWGQTDVLVKMGERGAEEAAEAAHHDSLTGLPNRRLLDRRVEQAFVKAHAADRLALLMLDLDGFKAVNDSLGHPAGDELLKLVAQRLRSTVRTRDLVVRLGGDEFVIFVEGYRDTAELRELGARLLHAISEPMEISNTTLQVGVSIGLCVVDPRITTLAALLRGADSALYQAKREGKGAMAEYNVSPCPASL